MLFINKGLFEKTFFRDFLTKCCRGQSSFMGMNFFCNPKLQMRFLLLKRKIVNIIENIDKKEKVLKKVKIGI